jgi:hypothetical protein
MQTRRRNNETRVGARELIQGKWVNKICHLVTSTLARIKRKKKKSLGERRTKKKDLILISSFETLEKNWKGRQRKPTDIPAVDFDSYWKRKIGRTIGREVKKDEQAMSMVVGQATATTDTRDTDVLENVTSEGIKGE